MTSRTRLRFLLTILLILLAIPAVVAMSGLLATYHASCVAQRGASVDYGVKGGYFITLNDTTDLRPFIEDCMASLNYLSQHYPLTIRLDGRDLANVDLRGLNQIKGKFCLSLRNAKIDEALLEQLIAMHNLRGIDAANTMVPHVWLARFNQTRSQ